MQARYLTYFLAAFLTIVVQSSSAQEKNIKAQIENAITENRLVEAESLLQTELNSIFNSGNFDSIAPLTQYLGRINNLKFNPDVAIQKVNLFINKLKSATRDPLILSDTYTHAGEFFGSIGMNELAYKANEKAFAYALEVPNHKPELLASIESDLGTFAFRMGNISLSRTHHQKAIEIFLAAQKKNYDAIYVAANNIGGIMWMSSKMDSAIYYYNIALDALSKTEKTPSNEYYRPAVLNNNMAALYNMQGNTTKAIEAMETTIKNLKIYLSIKEDVPKKNNSVIFQFEAIDNLAGIYRELGDYTKAHELLMYSYLQKQKKPDGNENGIFQSQILLGNLYYSMHEHSKAIDFLTQGLAGISNADGDFLYWKADASNTLALIYDHQNNKHLASYYYEKADSLYEESLQGYYDDIYLNFLRNAALFYAENNEIANALAKSGKGFNYVKESQGTKTLLAFYQMINLSEIHLLAGNYLQSLESSKKSIEVVEEIAGRSNNMLDSIKTELKKPKAILLKAKAEFELLPKKSEQALKLILAELNQALAIIERRKAIVSDPKDIGILMSDHSELLSFIKKINLDLHHLTQDQGYIDKLIELQESGIYTRIRSRLDKSDSIRFAYIPASVQLKERQLKTDIRTALEKSNSYEKNIDNYFTALDKWEAFQNMIEKKYPHYYKLRYESILKPVGDIQRSIASGTTVIRYFFIDKDLYAIVIDKNKKTLLQVQTNNIEKNITVLTSYTANTAMVSESLYTLYHQLWAPLKPHIHNKKIVIIPDGILYNLNFEILTPDHITQFDQLATNSLLSNYIISYHYSLFLVGQKNEADQYKDNFIAFAPGFLDEEKKRYRSSVSDSFEIDHNYVSLLPQPFTISFATKASKMLGGDFFINEESTASSFKNNAGKHRIIYIGTHAESNNVYPEFSRLIFSKNDHTEKNSLFLYEIYNCNLSSELAILTACESGKPGFQDGEGMISLAHAFNYAGSESIITGLWKIDEKASTILMEFFYRNLMEGMAKDEALRQAKLSYLKQAKGRMLAPQYWAGMVLMGDTEPIQFEKKRNSYSWWPIAGASVLLLSGILLYLKRNRSRRGK